MQENRLKVMINKPIDVVFEFTTNPKNTHLWVPFVDEEVAEEFPPKIGTVYKSRRGESWNEISVSEYTLNGVFKLENAVFFVKYVYTKIDENNTQLEYIEAVKQGKLKNSFTQEVLDKLKSIIESYR